MVKQSILAQGSLTKAGTFYAQLYSRQNTAEIVVFPLDTTSKNDTVKIVSETSLIKRFHLDAPVSLYTWVYVAKASNGGRKTRRSNANGHAAAVNGDVHQQEDCYLFVALKDGKNYVFSPFKDDAIAEFEVEGGDIVNVVPSVEDNGTYWINLGDKAELYNVYESKRVKSVVYPDSFQAFNIVVSQGDDSLVVANEKQIRWINVDDGKVVGELNDEFIGYESIGGLLQIDDFLIISCQGVNALKVFDIKKKQLITTIETSLKIVKIFQINNDSIVGFANNGQIEIISNVIHNNNHDSKTIKTQTKKNITSVIINKDTSSLLVSWFDLEPKFKSFSSLDSLSNLTIIETEEESTTSQQLPQHNRKNSIKLDIPEEIEFIESYKLRETDLINLIISKINEPLELLKILNSNSNEDKIKKTVSKFTDSNTETTIDITTTTISKIFNTLTSKPDLLLQFSTLMTWLKWILVFHSSFITQLPGALESLKLIKENISTDLGKLPGFLSLQGRLELLQSQLQLRQALANGDVDFDNSAKIVNDLVSKAEESIVYVNGENDEEEVDDLIASVGNSESEVSDDEDDEVNGEEEGNLEEEKADDEE